MKTYIRKLSTALLCAISAATAATAAPAMPGQGRNEQDTVVRADRSIRIAGRVTSVKTADGRQPLVLVRTDSSDGFRPASLDTIKPQQIESLSILKDSSADGYATYGDTSEGVVLVTLKNAGASSPESRAWSLSTAEGSPSPLILLERNGAFAVTDSAGSVKPEGIKTMMVIRDSTKSKQFAEYGDTSQGVIVIELKEGVAFPAGARVTEGKPELHIRQHNDRKTDRKRELLILAETADGKLEVIRNPKRIAAGDVESMTMLKDSSVARYAAYGDTSSGVILVKFKNGAAPDR